MTEGKPFQAGDEVFIVGSKPHHATLTKVAKVYKTGNFVLEGSSQQYRPSGHEAGQPRWSPLTVYHATDEMRAKFDDAKKLVGLRQSTIETLSNAVSRVRNANTTAEIREIMTTLWDDQSDD